MKIPILFTSGAILAPAFLALIATHAAAQAAPPGVLRASTLTRVLHDAPGDGNLWSIGASWKASFGADGAVYYPRVGSSEPRRLPHALSPDRVTIGGDEIAFDRSVEAVRIGDRIDLDRGAFVERYDLALETVEQSFVFYSLPRAGDLVLRIPVASELEAVETDAGLEFRSERGHITYSRAVAVDARGQRTSAATTIEDGAITIRVDADLLADAELPLVIDPVLGAIFPDLTQDDTFSLDAAYDAFDQVWVVVYEKVFSATDHDVIAEMYSSTGTFIAQASIDVTGDKWVTPRIADLAFAHKFLVVAGSTAAIGGAKTARGRIAEGNGALLTTDPQISISGTLTGDCILPDVGGDSSTDAPGSWCVVFQRNLTIVYVLVASNGNIAVGPTTVPTAVNASDGSPSISKANDSSAWLVAWNRSFSLNHSIQGARISPSGTLITSPFFVGGGTFIGEPCASSPIHGTNLTAVVWQGGIPILSGGSTAVIALLDGGTVLQVADLMTLENSATAGENQIEPSVDSDGEHFLVSYSEFTTQFAHYRMHATDLAVVGNALQVVQGHMELQPGLGQSQERSNVAAARASGALAHRYLVVYDYRQNDVDHDAAGRFVEGLPGGPTPGSSFCSGDGSLATPCPCVPPNTVPNPSGEAGHGCANTFNLDGAFLSATGALSPDTIQFTCDVGGNYASFALMLKGDATNPGGVANGDGVLCVTGALRRFGGHNAGTGGASLGTWTLPNTIQTSSISAASSQMPGQTAYYQLFYRNAQPNFCNPATTNWSNGYSIVWPP